MLVLLLYLGSLIALSEEQLVSCAGKVCPLGFDCISVNGVLQCADPCYQNSVLNDAWRSVDNTNNNPVHCDQNINWDGWYRFYLGQADAHIPQKCVAEQRCGTHAPLWITEPHPTQMNQVVNRTVCSAWSGSCCLFPTHTIQVKLCSGYYVYKLGKPSVCYLAYCAEPNVLMPDGFRVSGQTQNSITLQWNKMNNVASYVLQFNGAETNINAPSGVGPVTYTVSPLAAGTTYTFTLYSVSDNIRSPGVQLVASTDAGAEVFTIATKFNISSCPITFYQKVYTNVYVNFTSDSLVFCFNGFYGLDTNNDCVFGPKPDSVKATFNITEHDSSLDKQVKEAVRTITSSMGCGVHFSTTCSSQKTDLNLLGFGNEAALYFTSTPNKSKLVANITVAGTYVESVTLESPSTGRFTDISGCRVSGVGILPNTTVFLPQTCTTVVCTANKSYTSTGCGNQQRCDGNGVCLNTTCTVTGPTVIDFNGHLGFVADRCAYSLMSDSKNNFKVLASFQERRRRDVSFLDSVTLQLDDPGVQIHLEQGGRVQINNTILNITSSVQRFQGVELFKDQTGVTATFSVAKRTTSVFFDGYTAQIQVQAPAGSSLKGLCSNSSDISNTKLPEYSSSSCGTQFDDPDDNTVNCDLMTERCNILKAAPFSSCNEDVDPTPYVNACKNTLCTYPSVDHLWCQFLWSYVRACSLDGNSVDDSWQSEAKCSSKAFCQDNTCKDHEFCGRKLSGEPGCLCRAVFASRYKESNSLGDRPVCKQKMGVIALVGCLLEEKGINYTSLHLKDPSCVGVLDKETHMVTFKFDENNICGTEILKNGSQTTYKNAIMNQRSSDVITRQDQIYINISCYDSQLETKAVTFKIKDRSVVQKITSGDLDYSLTMKAYTDRRRTQLVNPQTDVLLNQKIWVELKADGLDADLFAVVTDFCWITSQQSPNSYPKHDLIKSGCPVRDDETVQVRGNGEGTSNYFSFNMVEFTGISGDVYLHCTLQLCIKQESNCVPNCSGGRGRRRRSMGTGGGHGV
ncbi:uncharacterized protein [Nothobranchius furzeri]